MHAACVDDTAPALLQHVGQRCLGCVESRVEADGNDVVPFVLWKLLNWADVLNACSSSSRQTRRVLIRWAWWIWYLYGIISHVGSCPQVWHCCCVCDQVHHTGRCNRMLYRMSGCNVTYAGAAAVLCRPC
jgi:hypothetical protein